jgi:hypothetical protein
MLPPSKLPSFITQMWVRPVITARATAVVALCVVSVCSGRRRARTCSLTPPLSEPPRPVRALIRDTTPSLHLCIHSEGGGLQVHLFPIHFSLLYTERAQAVQSPIVSLNACLPGTQSPPLLTPLLLSRPPSPLSPLFPSSACSAHGRRGRARPPRRSSVWWWWWVWLWWGGEEEVPSRSARTQGRRWIRHRWHQGGTYRAT